MDGVVVVKKQQLSEVGRKKELGIPGNVQWGLLYKRDDDLLNTHHFRLEEGTRNGVMRIVSEHWRAMWIIMVIYEIDTPGPSYTPQQVPLLQSLNSLSAS